MASLIRCAVLRPDAEALFIRGRSSRRRATLPSGPYKRTTERTTAGRKGKTDEKQALAGGKPERACRKRSGEKASRKTISRKVQGRSANPLFNRVSPGTGGRSLLGEQLLDVGQELGLLHFVVQLLFLFVLLIAVEQGGQLVHGQNDAEVDHKGDDEEVDDGPDEKAEPDRGIIEGDDPDVLHIRHLEDGGDEGLDHARDQAVDDGGDGGAHDEGDGHLHHVSAGDEFLESFEHYDFLLGRNRKQHRSDAAMDSFILCIGMGKRRSVDDHGHDSPQVTDEQDQDFDQEKEEQSHP